MGMGSSDMADTTRRFKYAFPSRHGMLFFAAALSPLSRITVVQCTRVPRLLKEEISGQFERIPATLPLFIVRDTAPPLPVSP